MALIEIVRFGVLESNLMKMTAFVKVKEFVNEKNRFPFVLRSFFPKNHGIVNFGILRNFQLLKNASWGL